MKWFKTMWLTSEEREILKRAKEQPVAVAQIPEPVVEINDKPYKNIFYSNRNLTVVFNDGTMRSKSDVDTETFLKVRNASSEKEIDSLLVDLTAYEPAPSQNNKIETPAERKLVTDNLDVFRGKTEFELKGTDVYLRGVNLAMPAPVVASFIEVLEKYDVVIQHPVPDSQKIQEAYDNLVALRMFWLKLALNPLPQSREDLLVFARKNDIRITKNGNLILYRRIVTKTGADTQLVTFISQSYYGIKKQGQDPRAFAIAKDGDDYTLIELDKYDGNGPVPFVNLQVAYLELPTFDTNTFTAHHDRSVEIKIGGIYKIPDNKINLNNSICAAGGLHAAAVDYNYSGFGDMPVVVLVNPSKAITVPMGETGKLRTTEMFVACVNDKPQGTHFDESALSAFDSEYHDLTLTELEEAAKNKSFEALSVQDTVPAISLVDLNAIRNMLRKRVSAI